MFQAAIGEWKDCKDHMNCQKVCNIVCKKQLWVKQLKGNYQQTEESRGSPLAQSLSEQCSFSFPLILSFPGYFSSGCISLHPLLPNKISH